MSRAEVRLDSRARFGSKLPGSASVIEYRQTGKLLPAFKVNIADVTGFSVRRPTRQDRKSGGASGLQQVFVLQGSGTDLASCPVSYGTAEKVEAWIRAHPAFRGNVPQGQPMNAPPAPASNLADELAKLAQLRDSGALSPEEFERAKAKLLIASAWKVRWKARTVRTLGRRASSQSPNLQRATQRRDRYPCYQPC